MLGSWRAENSNSNSFLLLLQLSLEFANASCEYPIDASEHDEDSMPNLLFTEHSIQQWEKIQK